MLTLTPKNLKAQVIAWDAERATMDFIQKHVQVECVIENLIPPCKLKVFLPDGSTTLLAYGDVIGRNEEGTLVIIPAADVEKYYDVNPIDILEAVQQEPAAEPEEVLTHTVTEADLTVNPELAEVGVQAGDEIGIPVNAIVEAPEAPAPVAETKAGKKGKK